MLNTLIQRLTNALRTRVMNVAIDRKSCMNRHGLRRNTRAQTMLEYALLAGFAAVVGAATMLTAPTTSDNVKIIINKVAKWLAVAAGAAAQSAC